MPTTSSRVGSGAPRSRDHALGDLEAVSTRRGRQVGQGPADPVEVERAPAGRRRRCGTAPGGAPPRTARTARSGSSCGPAAAAIRRVRRPRGTRPRPPSSPSTATASGAPHEQVGGVAAARPACGPAARRPTPSSRSSLRYQWVDPRSSDLAEGQQAAVGVGARPRTTPSITGSRVFWIAARRRHPGRQRLQVAHRPGGIGEAQRGEPLPAASGASRASAVEPGDRRSSGR